MMDGLALWRVAIAVIAVALVISLLPMLLRRFGPGTRQQTGQGGPELLGIRPLDMRHRLAVVRFGGQEHLLVLGGAQPVLVASAPDRTPTLQGTTVQATALQRGAG